MKYISSDKLPTIRPKYDKYLLFYYMQYSYVIITVLPHTQFPHKCLCKAQTHQTNVQEQEAVKANALRHLCLSQKAAPEHTAKTTAHSQLPRMFCQT